jgi:putative nucleotidyltransferase with HDIG domain
MDDAFSPPAEAQLLFARVASLARAHGVDAHAAGGTVRDVLLGRPMRDLDVAVSGDALAFARRLAGDLPGHFALLDDVHAVARVVLDDGPVGYIDVAQLQGSLEDDLRRRDFTVDALAAPLAGGAIIDVTGGMADLAAKRVRMTSPRVFDEDPLRLLRGPRIASELGFTVDDATAAEIRSRAANVRGAAAERRRDELARIFALERAYEALLLLDDLSLVDAVLPEVTFGRGVTQPGGFHAYDVFEHNLRTVEALDAMIGAICGSRVPATEYVTVAAGEVARTFDWCAADMRAYFGDEMSEGRSRSSILKLAGLLHDVAKPQTRTLDDQGAHFYGHADEGAAIARRVMRRLRFSAKEARWVSLLVSEHLRPVQLAQVGEAPTRRALYRFYRDLGDAVPAVIFLALADAAASRGPRLTAENWAPHVRYMNSLLVRSYDDAGIVNPPRLLTGRDIMRELGLPEGPRIGRHLEALREAQAAGEVASRAEALAFIRARDAEGHGEGGPPR